MSTGVVTGLLEVSTGLLEVSTGVVTGLFEVVGLYEVSFVDEDVELFNVPLIDDDVELFNVSFINNDVEFWSVVLIGNVTLSSVAFTDDVAAVPFVWPLSAKTFVVANEAVITTPRIATRDKIWSLFTVGFIFNVFTVNYL